MCVSVCVEGRVFHSYLHDIWFQKPFFLMEIELRVSIERLRDLERGTVRVCLMNLQLSWCPRKRSLLSSNPAILG